MVLGITGISGSGKHVAAQFLKKKEWVILDADKIAHRLYRPYTSVWREIVREFSESILTQSDVIDRVKLGKIVFNAADPTAAQAALDKLNAIVHPYLRRRLKDEVHRYYRRKANIAIVIALWKQVGAEEFCEKTLLIKADPELRKERTKKRDGISDATYAVRIKNQIEPENPDFVIENNGTLDEFRLSLNGFYKDLKLNE